MARQNRRLTRRARYGRFTEGPDPLAPPVDIREAFDAMGQDVMAGYSPERAMREFLRRGGRGQTGLDELARRVAKRRRELTEGHNLDGTLREVRKLLDRAVLEERRQLARDAQMDDVERALSQMQLDNLPASPASAVSELNDYTWHSQDARDDFERIKDLLGRELLDQRFAGMKQALENATDADRAAIGEMLNDLNDLLDAHARGEDGQQQFDEFMAKHGQYFPEQPGTIDELLDTLAQRAAAAQRMWNSMSAEQRQELESLATQAFGSPELMSSLSRLDASLRSQRPQEDWSGSEDLNGPEGLGLGDGTGALQDIADLDELAEQLAQSYEGSQLDDLDLEKLARQLGPDAAVDAHTLQRLERALRDSGLMRRTPDGQYKLVPRAMRRLGKNLLREIGEQLSERQGAHDIRRAGPAGEFSGATRPWAFGDVEPWDVTRTITNAITRQAAEGVRTGTSVAIEMADVEVQETEARTRACVALLVDTSFSMAMEDRWVPMKRMALALHTLITSRFRGDDLQIIGFGRSAQVMSIEDLIGLDIVAEQGTNLHHALLLANQHFRRHPSAQPVLLIVTDGEPTAHLERSGESVFSYPPEPLTIALAVRELDAATRRGAHTTFFRLGDDPGLARFVDAMARRVGGAVDTPDANDLGAAVIGSYLDERHGYGASRSGQDGPDEMFGTWSS